MAPAGPETATTRQVLELIAGEVGLPVGVRSVPKLVMRALGLFNPMMRELAEMAYEFEEPFVLDTSKYESTFGAAGTPLAHAIAATVAWYRTQTATPDTPTQEGPTSSPAPTRASPPPQAPLATSPERPPALASDQSPTRHRRVDPVHRHLRGQR